MGDGAARHGMSIVTALRGADPCRVMTRQNKSLLKNPNLNTFL